jgi:glucosamine--fructose-6-phosphate aminotransferase (isomerizing)
MALREEIFEQPARLRGLIDSERAMAEKIAAEIRKREVNFVFLAARGTSDNAGRYANYLWGAHNHLPIALATPSLFTYYQAPPLLKNALVVCISQSGESPDIVNVLKEGRKQGALTLAITNEPDSPLGGKADLLFELGAGEEKAVAATKTYTAELTALAMISTALNGDKASWDQIDQLPAWVDHSLEQEAAIAAAAKAVSDMQRCVVLARGFNYATCFEWALKIKELAYVVAEPYSSADFLHGPIAIVEEGFRVMSVATSGPVFDSMRDTLIKLREELAAELVVLSDKQEALDIAQHPISLPSGIPEWLSPAVAIVPGQLFAYHLALAKGYDTEQPRGLKKVTRTH